ncbi:aldehyde dehydrogenase family protein [Methanoregula formicica]|uniref:NAD-dependent aldehyde dehydrogenase n=1 Tax=Methanoregula formicica (strain DSM 22288 / NBRC 105244 / SMSP) TaxID=593750 RepID=L0H9P0_METFS|nr:aldehyde dehydrogenase family protein [Methanoregula formicica]AGB01467.1 NAD-dependent aldehyde dehydrogenase [Methanoregula formicica SMSP]
MAETYPLLLGGEKKKTKETIPVRFPYTGELYCTVSQATNNDLKAAVTKAVSGFEKTRRLPSHARAGILENLADTIHRRAAELIDVMVMEGGKTRKFATTEVARAEVTVRTSAEEAKRVYGEIIPLDLSRDTEGRTGILRRFPLGPVAGIVPFNFPLNLACHKLAPALAAGNSVILKPASATPLSSLLLGEMALDAGVPPEAVSVVPCTGARAEVLARDPRVAFLSFTGSCAVGWHLREIAGRKKVGLELGGNAAVIVHEDANLPYAAQRIVTGGFTNAGQVCISVQRVLVHRKIYEELVEMIVAGTKALKVGDPRDPTTDLGPMIDRLKAEEAYRKVQEAIRQGARALIGGTLEGTMFAPTVLEGTTPAMRVNCEEVFAPVISVVPYDDFDEALRIANTGEYGLQVGIFTQNLNRAMRAYAEMDVGGVIVNDIPTFRTDQMPYGGAKGSGLGREGPRFAIEEMSELRLMVINRDGGIG